MGAADKLRGSVAAATYKYPALGLVFLKYVSDMFDAQAKRIRKRLAGSAGRALHRERGQPRRAGRAVRRRQDLLRRPRCANSSPLLASGGRE
ncbi:type I restriction-modification system subunit M N-terminal domain-containing protein [Luteimonas chenhongjianii]|uniref:type I restriction-modification system subunit M N-terminal domain-containing protein n=1 Tax=Luteimonas chenhongjianii TaxID=2006110 RepID=UPI001FE724D1|nr:type I restriction-modification system subunit M N-terminal domain-containing protein [Luteimonas chenhongjianii]